MNLSKLTLECVAGHPGERFTARQIAEWIYLTYPAECLEKKERTALATEAALVQQLVAEISSQRPLMEKRFPQLKTTEGRPRRYFYSEQADEAELAVTENSDSEIAGPEGFTEHSLYPVLSEFLWRELAIYSKRIDERRGRNTFGAGGNRWLYPDLVGLQDLSEDWVER